MKENLTEKLPLKVRQRIELLLMQPTFISEVIFVRVHFEIRRGGFSSETEMNNWLKKMEARELSFYQDDWTDLMQEIKSETEVSNMNKYEEFMATKALSDKLCALSPHSTFKNAINKIVKKFGLSPKYEQFVINYIFLGEEAAIEKFVPNAKIDTTKDCNGKLNRISIEIEDDTTIKDVKAIWSKIKELQSQLPYKKHDIFQPIKNIKRDEMAYELRRTGKTYREIAETISDDFHIACSYTDIPDYIKRHKKRVGKA